MQYNQSEMQLQIKYTTNIMNEHELYLPLMGDAWTLKSVSSSFVFFFF